MRLRSLTTITILLALFPVGALIAGTEGRVSGTVVDQQGKPIADAVVTLMAQEVQLARSTETNRKGKFSLIVADATKTYLIRIEKDGYTPIQEPIDVPLGDLVRKTWTLEAGEGTLGAAIVEGASADPAVKAYNDGARAFNLGEVDGALAKFREASEINPELAEAWSGMAMIHWSRQETAQAVAAAEKLVALEPENVLGLRMLYDAYRELGDPRQRETLDVLVTVDRTEGTAKRVYNLGVEAVRGREAEEAIKRFEQALEIDPTLAPAYSVVGQLYNQVGDYEKAIARAKKLLELVPGSPDAHNILYNAHGALGNVEEAQKSLVALQSAEPEKLATALLEEGQRHFNAGDMAQAQQVLEQLLSVQPDHPGAHYTLGLCYLNTGDNARAKEVLTRFLELAPEHPEAGAAREMLGYLE